LRVVFFLSCACLERTEKLEEMEKTGGGKRKATSGAAAGMDAEMAMHWDEMVNRGPAGGLLGKGFMGAKAAAAAAAGDGDDDGAEGGGEAEATEVVNSRLGAAEIYNCPPERRLHMAIFKKKTKHVFGLKKTDLATYLKGSSDHPVAGPRPIVTTMVPTQLAVYE
jgi:hypothetical protein